MFYLHCKSRLTVVRNAAKSYNVHVSIKTCATTTVNYLHVRSNGFIIIGVSLIAHIRFVVESVLGKLANTRNKPCNDDNMISMPCIFGAIHSNMESFIVLSTITQ